MVDGGLSDDAERRAAWSRLWAQGGAGSFLDVTADGNLPLRDHWQAWFATLPAGAHVLDIATGNGILPRWLIAAHPSATCDAIDLATIQPSWQHERVRFHGGVAAEQLPWREPRFDAIVSQFGAEYGDLDVIVGQLTATANPGSVMRLVLHHPNSRPSSLADEELRHAHWLLHSGWMSVASEMIEPLSLLLKPGGPGRLAKERRFAVMRQRFDALQAERVRRSMSSVCPDLLEEAGQAAARAFGLAARQGQNAAAKALAVFATHLGDNAIRLVDMRTHVVDTDQMVKIQALLAALGWRQVDISLVHEREYLMGWALQAQRLGMV